MKKVFLLAFAMFVLHAHAYAQTATAPLPPPPAGGPPVMFYQSFPAPPPGPSGAPGSQADFIFISSGAEKIVTGAPYTAEAVTESIQMLADGNRISNKTSTSLARDSQGRTRRQETMGNVGPLQMKGPRMIFISDPVSQTDYVLDLDKQTARTMKRQNIGFTHGTAVASGAGIARSTTVATGMPGAQVQRLPFPPGADSAEPAKTESLGTRVIEGVFVQGNRTTRTIPVGQIGNERPLEITSEVWFSPDLQAIVSSEHSDPRFGKTIYTLTNINRAEPSLSLFEVPAGYTVSEPPASGPAFGIRVGPPDATFELPLPPPVLP